MASENSVKVSGIVGNSNVLPSYNIFPNVYDKPENISAIVYTVKSASKSKIWKKKNLLANHQDISKLKNSVGYYTITVFHRYSTIIKLRSRFRCDD